MDGVTGFWAEDEETGEVGFLPDLEDVFWVYDDNTFAWVSSHFRGRRLRRGPPRGKGKGKGKGGKFRFRSRKGKGKGKRKGSFSNWSDGESTFFGGKGKGKGKKGKGKKGKDKGEGKDGMDHLGKGSQAHLATTPESLSMNPALEDRGWAGSSNDAWSNDTWWADETWYSDDT